MVKYRKVVEIANDDDFDDEDFDEASLSDEGDLRGVARLAKMIGGMSWFAAVGQKLEPSEIEDAKLYVSGLGFPEVRVAAVEDWRAAEAAAQAPDWSQDWWEAEEQLRRALLDEALTRNDEHDLMVALTHVSTRAGEVAHGLAAVSAARAGVADQALIKVAAGAAAQAAYQAALVLAAGEDSDHPFAVKFRLFEAGRLPLGIVGSTFNLF